MNTTEHAWRERVARETAAERADLVRRSFEVPADILEAVDQAWDLIEAGRFSRSDRRAINAAAGLVREYFLKSKSAYLVGFDADPKTAKSNKVTSDWYTVITYLTPGSESGWNVCGSASVGCLTACLNFAGHGSFSLGVQLARLRRTFLLMAQRRSFWVVLASDLLKYRAKADRDGVKLAYRPNGTSDLKASMILPEPLAVLVDQIYDYTAHTAKALGNIKTDYSVTFSRKETTSDDTCRMILEAGGTVAAVFEERPVTWLGFPTIDGDEHDMRFLDRPGHVVALTAKGPAKTDDSGFVIRA